MIKTIKVIQLIVAISLTALVLIQAKGGGLSSMVSTGTMYRSRRGLERIVFITTIILGVLFSVNSLFLLYLS